jgi:flagella basal body P-ring formation protein FlgA
MMCKDCIHAEPGRRSDLSIAFSRKIEGVAAACAPLVIAAIFALASGGALAEEPPTTPASPAPPAAPTAPSPISVQLWPTAVVTTDHVTLDDVSRVTQGEKAFTDALRLCEVAATPPAGSSTVITIDDVATALSRAGINPTRVILRGSSRCQIMHPGQPASTRPASAARKTAPKTATTRPVGRGAALAGPASAVRVDLGEAEPGTLGAAVRQYLAARVADRGGSTEIRLSPAVQRAMALSSPTYEFRIRPRDNDVLGLVALEADVFEGGKLVETVPIVAEVTLVKAVVVARSAINRGEIIQAKHLMLAERWFSKLSDIGISDLQSLIGQEANRYIENGAMLAARDVRARPLVKRGDIVTIWVRQGDLVIKSVAKALRAGTYGELIDVKNEATGETFAVTVTGPQTAEAGRNASLRAVPVAAGAAAAAAGPAKLVVSSRGSDQ